MDPFTLSALSLGAFGLGAGALAWWEQRGGARASAEDPPLAPAYTRLTTPDPSVRKALHDVSRELGLPADALATVIQSESDWDPTVPHTKSGVPRGGLIQLTQGANFPGFTTADAVWAVRAMPADVQLRQIVLPLYRRYEERSPGWAARIRAADDPALELYKWNFLPDDWKKPLDFKLGERDSTELIHPKSTITRGQVYSANPVFDPTKRGYFTWRDVAAKLRRTETHAIPVRSYFPKARPEDLNKPLWVTLSGRKVLPPVRPAAPVASSASGVVGAAATTTAATSSAKASATAAAVVASGAACSPAQSLLQLRRQVDERWPRRSKASDGLCGDAAHQARESDHNKGLALDLTHDPTHGPPLETLAQALLKDPRVTYVIWNARIASRDRDGGAWRPYPQDPAQRGKVNPHTRHLHLSIRADARDDARSWTLPSGSPGARPADVGSTKSVQRRAWDDPVGAWFDGLIDNIWWVEIPAPGGYLIRVAGDPLSCLGLRLPFTFAEVVSICRGADLLPHTHVTADARWRAASRRLVVPLLGTGAQDYESSLKWNAQIGRLGTPGEIVDGPWKEWILTDDRLKRLPTPDTSINYGGRLSDAENAAVVQTPGMRHNWVHKDYSQLFAPLARKALKNGQPVDLLDELARGCELGGPLPPWLIERLR
ncbi:hypothetical protein [Polyangium fumosum]|uniref:ARB-07466-like C-terminal domain-containing protein n=1 Tax=Polyangium fumosum TaxID=889272 RepID=A0A4U1J085_9BACT|nr:hypothetical protein [Polyangium fumosum]TKD00414.1 hypothetical protein E8A74_34535 [Polyangium fumosum]